MPYRPATAEHGVAPPTPKETLVSGGEDGINWHAPPLRSYFEDVQTGLVTMARLGGDTRYGRFTDKDVRPEIKPSRN